MLALDSDMVSRRLMATLEAHDSLTLWNHALQNWQMMPIKNPPAWYVEINNKLEASKLQSNIWLSSTAAEIFSVSTQSLANYSGLFVPAIAALKQKIAQLPPHCGQEETKDLRDVINLLLGEASATRLRLRNLSSQAETHRAQAAADFDAVHRASDKAMEQHADQREAIDDVKARIAGIRAKFAVGEARYDDSVGNIRNSSIGFGLSLTFGLAFAGMTFGAGGVVVAMLTGAAAYYSAFAQSDEMKRESNKLAQALGELADDQKQLAILDIAIGALQSLAETSRGALQATTGMTDLWGILVMQLEYLNLVLSQPKVDLASIPDLKQIDAAAAIWNRIASVARTVQERRLDIGAIQIEAISIQPSLSAVS